MPFIDLDVLFHAAEHPEFSLYANTFGVRFIDYAPCNGDIFFERLVASIDHDGAVKTGCDAVVASFFVPVIEMHGKNRFGKHSFSRPDDRFEHSFIGIFSRTFRKLDDKWRLALHITTEQAETLFHVVNVVRADSEFAVSDLVELSGGNDHKPERSRSSLERWRSEVNLTMGSKIGKWKISQLPADVAGNITVTEVPCGVESMSTRPL